MFQRYVTLQDYLSSAKLIFGSILIFFLLFVVSVVIIIGLFWKNPPIPAHQKKAVVGNAAGTFLLNVLFLVLTFYDAVSLLSVLASTVLWVVFEYGFLKRFFENPGQLLKTLAVQGVLNAVWYFAGSFYMEGFFILFFCMGGI